MNRRVKVNKKGKSRHFSSPEEIQAQLQKLELEEDESDQSDEGGDDGKNVKKSTKKDHANESGSSSSASSSDDSSGEEEEQDEGKPKGVSGLIQIENPNRGGPKKPVDPTAPVQLSRREREEIEKQKARARYEKLHAEGKTDQAKADLARLAIIRQQRAEQAAKKQAESAIKQEDAKKKLQQSNRKIEKK